jgi:hypothetical protein
MSRNTAQSATIIPDARLERPLGAGTSAPAQVLLDLARPWGVIASQLLLMAEPFFSPEQRGSLQKLICRLESAVEPHSGSGPDLAGAPVPKDGPERVPGGRAL